MPGRHSVSALHLVHLFTRLICTLLSYTPTAVRQLQLRWLWSQATRKLAGWHSVAVLHLAHPDYVEDWALLRTLRGLKHLTLAKGSGRALLVHVLCIASDLPGLQVSVEAWR